MRTLKTLLLVVLLASSSAAAPKKGKVTCEVDTIQAGHRVRLDPNDYTAREAVAIVTAINMTGKASVFAVCGIETAEVSK